MAMTGLRAVTTSLGLVRVTPPEELGANAARPLLRRLPPERRRAAVELGHWAVGAAAGGAFGALADPRRAPRWAGVAYGIGIQAAFEAVVAPLLGDPGRDRPATERLAIAADHALFGLVLSRG